MSKTNLQALASVWGSSRLGGKTRIIERLRNHLHLTDQLTHAPSAVVVYVQKVNLSVMSVTICRL